MTARSSYADRLPYHSILNKGHHFAIVERDSRKIVTSARRAESLKPLIQFRSDLEMIDVRAALDPLMPTQPN